MSTSLHADLPDPTVFERLSRNPIWEQQRCFFRARGAEAWSQGLVPHYITSNTFIANTYVGMILGWLRDAGRALVEPHDGPDACPDTSEPLYIIEIGSGSGRFAFHFLRLFTRSWSGSGLKNIAVKYVMTDFAERTVAFWQDHPSFQPFVQAGVLDFAQFDPECDDELRLLASGDRLAPGTVSRPMAVIANYVFDSIPHDAFAVIGGELHECRARVARGGNLGDKDCNSGFDHFELEFENRPIAGDYYENPAWDRVLRQYERRLDDTVFTFPVAALGCLERLARLAGGHLLLLSADRGFGREVSLLGRSFPEPAVHGSFSLLVNYHAIGEVIRADGGEYLTARQLPSQLTCVACVLGASEDFSEMRRAIDEALERLNPDDYFTMKKGLEHAAQYMSLEALLGFLRMSSWDAKLFVSFADRLRVHAQSASWRQMEELTWAARCVWENHLPIGEADDLAAILGDVVMEASVFPEALAYYERSLELNGPTATNCHRLALVHQQLGRLDLAADFVEQALDLDPNLAVARALKVEIESSRPAFVDGTPQPARARSLPFPPLSRTDVVERGA